MNEYYTETLKEQHQNLVELSKHKKEVINKFGDNKTEVQSVLVLVLEGAQKLLEEGIRITKLESVIEELFLKTTINKSDPENQMIEFMKKIKEHNDKMEKIETEINELKNKSI